MIISLVSAMSLDGVIGSNNQLPWHIPEELQYFKKITMGKPMIMGRKTFDSIGRRLLSGRKTIILTQDRLLVGEGFIVSYTVAEALAAAGDVPEVMIVGGATVYRQFLPLAQRLYLSIIPQEYTGDAYFPQYDADQWTVTAEEDHQTFKTKILERREN